MTEPAIEYRNVVKKYGDEYAVKNFNLSIEHGEFITIVGSSGGGKTTVLKMVNSLVVPTSGDIFMYGKNIKDENLIKLRRKIGYAIQGNVLFPHLDVSHNIGFVPRLSRHDNDKVKESILKALDLVGLDRSLLKKYPHELSGGQQQRVGIARSLVSRPYILLMDEPFGAVDEITRSSLQEEISGIHQKTDMTVLFVTHDMHEAFRLGTRVLVMNKGEAQQFDTPENISEHPANDYVKLLLASVSNGSSILS